MIQRMLAIWSLVPLPFLKPAWTSGSSQFMYCWSLAWRILSITLLACEMSFTEPIFAWKIPLVSLIFLKRSLVFPILLLSSISLHWSLRKAFLSLLAILWNSAFRWKYKARQKLAWLTEKQCPFTNHFLDLKKPFSERINSSFFLLFSHSYGRLFCNPMHCNPSGSSVHISQARILEWVAISFSRGSFQPKDQTRVSCIGRWNFTTEPWGKSN